MKWFNKIMDFPTGNYYNFKKEVEAYDKIILEVKAIEDLLDCFVEEEKLSDYPELYERFRIRLKSLKDAIKMEQIKKANVEEIAEKNKIQIEIDDLKLEYKKLYETTKDILLERSLIAEINHHLTEIKVVIKRMAYLKDFVNKEVWTRSDLQSLCDKIFLRKVEITPYIGKMER